MRQAGRATAQTAAADEEAHEPTFVRSAACARVLLVDVVVLFLASLAQEVGEEHAAQAPTARYAAANQEAREPMVLGSAVFLLLIVVVLLPASLLKEAGQEQATQAPTARYAAADQEAREPMVLGSAAFLLLIISSSSSSPRRS